MTTQEKRMIPFSPPDITEEEINEVVDALRSGWITTGPKTKLLEKEVAKYCGADRAVCLNSQTACAEMTLRVLGVGPGDEVIVPAYTYSATASVVEHVGAQIVMVDCEKDKFTMDYKALESQITEKTKVIIPVDLFGIPADYEQIFAIVERKKHLFKPGNNEIQKQLGRIAVVADAAHSFGASYKGQKTGALADFSCFSFHAVKNLTTAEGGAVTWKTIDGVSNDDLYRHYMLLSLHGQSKDALAKTQLGAWEYDIVAPWYKCNMTDVHAAIGLSQLRRYDEMLRVRQRVVDKYDQAFGVLPIKVAKHFSKEKRSSKHLYVIRLFNKDGSAYSVEQRNQFIIKMAELGVATNVHYKPLPMHTGYQKLGFSISNFPNAYEMFANEVTLPLTSCLSEQDVDYIISCVKQCLN